MGIGAANNRILGRLGASWGRLGPPWGYLGASWAVLEASWGRLGASWRRLGASWGVLGRLGCVLGRLGSVLETFWERFGSQNHPNKNLLRYGTGSAVLLKWSLLRSRSAVVCSPFWAFWTVVAPLAAVLKLNPIRFFNKAHRVNFKDWASI